MTSCECLSSNQDWRKAGTRRTPVLGPELDLQLTCLGRETAKPSVYWASKFLSLALAAIEPMWCGGEYGWTTVQIMQS